MTDNPTELPTLTSAGYALWLRAQRPPLEFFLELSTLEQETLADLGDEHIATIGADLAIGIADALRNPQAAVDGAGLADGDPEAEESMVRRLAGQFAAHLLQKNAPAKQPDRMRPMASNGTSKPDPGFDPLRGGE